MNSFTTPSPSATSQSNRSALVRAHPRIAASARWFWWIAALSVVNSIIVFSGGAVNFVVGLATTQIVDAVFRTVPVLALVFDAVAVAGFIGAGVLALRGWLAAFVAGGLVYAIDGAICAWFGDWLSAAFHAFVLYQLFKGWRDLRDLVRHAGMALQTPLVPGVPVALASPGPALRAAEPDGN